MKQKRHTNEENRMIYEIMDTFDRDTGRDIGNNPHKMEMFKLRKRRNENRQKFIHSNRSKVKY